MTAYTNFSHSGLAFPLGTPDADSGLLATADPALAKVIDFAAAMLTTYLGDALATAANEATLTGAAKIVGNVGYTLPIDPGLVAKLEQFDFPLLAVWRESEKHDYRTVNWRETISQLGCAYILPPMTSAQAQRLWPVLAAVSKILDAKFTMGFDPTYNDGEMAWTDNGIDRVRVMTGEYSSAPFGDEKTGAYFHAWMGKLEMVERVSPSTAGFNDLTLHAATITDESTDEGNPVDMVDLEIDAT